MTSFGCAVHDQRISGEAVLRDCKAEEGAETKNGAESWSQRFSEESCGGRQPLCRVLLMPIHGCTPKLVFVIPLCRRLL
jgi:hypothetical protein